MRDNNPKSKPPETSKKVRGMYDLFESTDKRNERIIKLELDSDNEIYQAAAVALLNSQYLSQSKKKTAAKDYEKKLDKLTKQALKLSEAIKELESPGYRNHLENNFLLQINPGETIYCGFHGAERIVHALIKAIQSAKESAIKPINDGYYTPFLFCFVSQLFIRIRLSFIFRYQLKETVPTKGEIKKILTKTWKKKYSELARETAIKVILKPELKRSSGDRQVAQKPVDKNLNHMVNKLIDAEADWLGENLKFLVNRNK